MADSALGKYADSVDAQGTSLGAYADAVDASHPPTSAPAMSYGRAVLEHLMDNIPGARQAATALAAAKMGGPASFGQRYSQVLGEDQRALDANPSRLGSLAGIGISTALMPVKTGLGLIGLGGLTELSNSTNDPNATPGSVAGRTAFGALTAPLLGKAVETAAPYAGRGLGWLGGKAEDLAGWLKVNSIHPNPKLGEAIEDLPGGKVGLGIDLLERGIGGMTKSGTAKQIEAARINAVKSIGDLAAKYDSIGGAPIDLTPALNKGLDHAAKLQKEPLTRAAGNKLEELIYEYGDKYRGQPVPASDALELKRVLGDEAYNHGITAKAGDTVAGKYGEGLGKLERSVDDALDQHLGPEFSKANLASRRLTKAGKAADTQDARGAANHLLSLLTLVAAGGGAEVHGGAGAATGGIVAMLGGKYGSQAGARTLYSPVAGSLNGLGEILSRAAPTEAGSRFAATQAGRIYPDLSSLLSPQAAAQGTGQ